MMRIAACVSPETMQTRKQWKEVVIKGLHPMKISLKNEEQGRYFQINWN